uniref:Leucine-rich repeat receptor-like protein kinase n=1 Tax=Pohlia nutans TaxID=140635 RepID=A0A1P8DYZ9_9BRYO|nr:leucine-rich repeat receptor-like protein kinase [Pohlia nutans]
MMRSIFPLVVVVVWVLVAGAAVAFVPARLEVDVLLDVKAALDPHSEVLVSWQAGGQPCSSFEGVLCNADGRVSNISLQGRSLSGFIPDALAELSALTGLFLHFNELRGGIPASLSSLTGLTDLYLNWNQLSSAIPPQLAQLSSLQVLELSCNKLEGELPVELANLSNLETLAVNTNNLNGTIPNSYGNMAMLARLDVSNNSLTGSIPDSVANLSNLVFLDVSHNFLSGPIPSRLFGLQQGFKYSNNSNLCGGPAGSGTSACPGATTMASPSPSSAPSKRLRSIMSIVTAIVFAIGGSTFLLLVFICLRRRNAKLRSHSFSFSSTSDIKSVHKPPKPEPAAPPVGGSFHGSTPDFSRSRVMSCRSTGLPSPIEWSSWMHLDELETATNYFSEKNLLRKNCHTAVYKGTLRDGSPVAVKAIYNTRYTFGEQDFQVALEALMQVKHENLVKFVGFCCSKGGSECFLVYAFVPDGSLEHRLHGQTDAVLDWSTRVKIIRGIAKGLAHLHEGLPEPLTMVHRNLWAGNVLLDKQGNALVADYGLSDIVAEEVMYATHKTLAALGYLAPEYAYLGQVTENSDIYAFGALVLEVLTGRRPSETAAWVRPLLELGKVREFVDPRLESRFSLAGAAGLAHVGLQCMADDVRARPSMADVVRKLHGDDGWADSAVDSFLATATAMAALPDHARRQAPFSRGYGDALHHCR